MPDENTNQNDTTNSEDTNLDNALDNAGDTNSADNTVGSASAANDSTDTNTNISSDTVSGAGGEVGETKEESMEPHVAPANEGDDTPIGNLTSAQLFALMTNAILNANKLATAAIQPVAGVAPPQTTCDVVVHKLENGYVITSYNGNGFKKFFNGLDEALVNLGNHVKETIEKI